MDDVKFYFISILCEFYIWKKKMIKKEEEEVNYELA